MSRTLVLFGLLVLALGQCASARADAVISTATETNTDWYAGSVVGQSFIDGPSNSILNSVTISLGPAPWIHPRGSRPGTGRQERRRHCRRSTVFSGFSESYNSAFNQLAIPRQIRASPSPRIRGYFLVLTDPGDASNLHWASTWSQSYTSADGFSLPSTDNTFVTYTTPQNMTNTMYNALSLSTAVFDLTATPAAAVPEPSSIIVALTCLLATAGVLPRRRGPKSSS